MLPLDLEKAREEFERRQLVDLGAEERGELLVRDEVARVVVAAAAVVQVCARV